MVPYALMGILEVAKVIVYDMCVCVEGTFLGDFSMLNISFGGYSLYTIHVGFLNFNCRGNVGESGKFI